ncbi:MAG: hypothetical protein KAJ19_08925 [Gammaproteobacteria bacterium]|nr:hypothetical protein [Gammaproteobacteria bacterium]
MRVRVPPPERENRKGVSVIQARGVLCDAREATLDTDTADDIRTVVPGRKDGAPIRGDP